MALDKGDIRIALESHLNKKGFTDLQNELMALQNKRLLSGGRFMSPAAKESAISTAVNREQRQQAKAQRQVLMTGLGTLFFFQQLNKQLGSFLQPAAEAVGIFEIFGVIMQLLFLPVMLALLPILLGVLKAISKMSKEEKMLIGIVVVVGYIISSIVAFGAQLYLFMGAIGLLPAAAGGAAVGLTGFLATLFAVVGPLLLIGAALYLLISNADGILKFLGDFYDSLIKFSLDPVGTTAEVANNVATGFVEGVEESTEKGDSALVALGAGAVGALEEVPWVGDFIRYLQQVDQERMEYFTRGAPPTPGFNEAANFVITVVNSPGISSNVTVEQETANRLVNSWLNFG
uniref:Tail tape measure protein n=1 Tax=viral metagenome TaxID=1070528 RepID=A0A6M3JN59_9ZZZZ